MNDSVRRFAAAQGIAAVLILALSFTAAAGPEKKEPEREKFQSIVELRKQWPDPGDAGIVFAELSKLYGEKGVKVMEKCSAIIVHELEGTLDLDLRGSSQAVSGFPKKKSTVIKDEKSIAAIRALLTDSNRFGGFAMAILSPRFAIELADGTSSVTVLFSPKAGVAWINNGEPVMVSPETIETLMKAAGLAEGEGKEKKTK